MLERENDELKRQIDKEKKEVLCLKSDLKCKNCDFAAESLTNFLVHVKKHTISNTDNIKIKEAQSKARKTVKHEEKQSSNCNKCVFVSNNQFDLLLHKSTKGRLQKKRSNLGFWLNLV